MKISLHMFLYGGALMFAAKGTEFLVNTFHYQWVELFVFFSLLLIINFIVREILFMLRYHRNDK